MSFCRHQQIYRPIARSDARHILAHAGLADVDTKLQKPSVNTRYAPARILAAHAPDECAKLRAFITREPARRLSNWSAVETPHGARRMTGLHRAYRTTPAVPTCAPRGRGRPTVTEDRSATIRSRSAQIRTNRCSTTAVRCGERHPVRGCTDCGVDRRCQSETDGHQPA